MAAKAPRGAAEGDAVGEFEPFKRFIDEMTRNGVAIPTAGAAWWFYQGYMRALREARVRWRGDGKHLERDTP